MKKFGAGTLWALFSGEERSSKLPKVEKILE
jgi:hypothetical protein